MGAKRINRADRAMKIIHVKDGCWKTKIEQQKYPVMLINYKYEDLQSEKSSSAFNIPQYSTGAIFLLMKS